MTGGGGGAWTVFARGVFTDLALAVFAPAVAIGVLAHDVLRGLVLAQPEERRVAELPVAGPLGEAHFGDELGANEVAPLRRRDGPLHERRFGLLERAANRFRRSVSGGR